jgi:phage shock protein C
MANSTLERIRSGLHLDKKSGWVAGVCAGIADYFQTDPALIRVIVIVAGLFLTKIVIALYLVAWLILEER